MRITRRKVAAAPAPVVPVVPVAVTKAFVRTDEDGAPKVDYAEVIERYTSKISNRKTAIRAFCVVCCNGALSEVKNCTVIKCPLHGFRMGEDPYNLKVQKRNGLVADEE